MKAPTESEKWQIELASAPIYMSIADAEGTIQYTNRAVSGLTVEEVVGTNFQDYEAPEYRELSSQAIEQVFRFGKSGSYEVRGLGPDATTSWYEVRYGPIERDGHIAAILLISIDITGRKLAEEALRYRLDFEKLIMKISSRFVRSGPDALDNEINEALKTIGRFAGVDRAYVFQLYSDWRMADNTHEWCEKGISPQIQNLKGIVMEEELPWFTDKLSAQDAFYIPSVKDLPATANLEKKNFQMQGIHSILVAPMLSGDTLTGFLGFDSVSREKTWSEDILALLKITGEVISNALERKRRDEELKKSEEKFRDLINFSPDPIAITQDGHYRQINPAFTALFGPKQQDLGSGLDSLEFIQDKDKDLVLKRHKDRLDGKEVSQTYRIDFIDKEGKEIPCETSSVVIPYNGRPAVLVIIRDITDRVEAEQEKERLQTQLYQAQRMEALGTLAGGIAHDFNNILYGIIGYAEIAIHHQIAEGHPARLSLDEILNASGRATDLVEQILTFSRKKTQERVKFQLSTVIKEALKLLRATIPASIEIKEKITAASDSLLADPSEIHQVLMNLCTNANHAMRDKGGVLEICLEEKMIPIQDVIFYPDLEPGPYLILTINDTGHGMDASIRERIFEPYFTTKPTGEGTGLGLSVVHGIVKSCGGTITVESEPGKGSSFKVFLPHIEKVDLQEPESLDSIPGGNERILFLDNEESLLKMGKQMLESLGYKVFLESSSIKALEAFKSDPGKYDLVISGLTMPEMSGDKLAEELIRLKPGIPIILCTGYSELITEEKTRQIGVRAFLTKPVAMRKMAETVRMALDMD